MLKRQWCAAVLLAAIIISCGTVDEQTDEYSLALAHGQALPDFPVGKPTARGTKADPPADPLHRVLDGQDCIAQQNCTAQPPALFLDGDVNNDYAWAMYEFEFMAGYAPTLLTCQVTPAEAGDEYYCAVANYATQRWDWSGPQTANTFTWDFGTAGRDYVSPADVFYFVIAVPVASQATHWQSSLDCEPYTAPPDAPMNFTASDGLYQATVLLRWDPVADADYYELWRQAPDATEFSLLGTSLGPICADQQITSIEQYTYQLRAVNSGGVGAFSLADSGFASGLPPAEMIGDNVISGTVTNENGQPQQGIGVRMIGPWCDYRTSDQFGHYRSEILYPGTYVVYTNFPGGEFEPSCSVVEFAGSGQQAVVDFQRVVPDPPANRFRGYVYCSRAGDADDGPLAGVAVTIVNQQTQVEYQATTDLNGYYCCLDLPNGDYSITPVLAGYTFNPPSANDSIDFGDATTIQQFVAQPVVTNPTGPGSLAGHVTFAGLDPVATTMNIYGLPLPVSTLSDPEDFSVDELPYGIYVVVPSHALTEYEPAYRIVELTADHPAGELNFTARQGQQLSAYRGFAWRALAGTGYLGLGNTGVIADDTSSEEQFSVATNLDGYFCFESLPPAHYTVTPQHTGWVFSPEYKLVWITGAVLLSPASFSARWEFDN